MSLVAKRGPGRPRSDASRQAILRAAYELLAEGGMRRFTIEGVAARSGSAKTTIYRWWSSRGLLATEALLCHMQQGAPLASEAGEPVVAQLRRHMEALAELLCGTTGEVLAGLIAEAQCCSETGEAVMSKVVQHRRQAGAAALERGMASGELRPDLDIETTLDALFGPFYARLMLRRFPPEPGWVDRLADTVLQGISAARD
jgi:AcrR family transcriptional regulator